MPTPVTRSLLATAATFATLAGGAAMTDGGLQLTAKVGDVRQYKLTAVVKFQDTGLTVTGGVTVRVVRVDDAGMITVQVTATNTTAKAGDLPVKVQDSPPLTEVFKPDGTLSELRGENASPTSYRLETLTSVKLPPFALANDKTWTWDIFPNSKVGIQRAKVVYKVLGEESVSGLATWKISRVITELEGENPASDTGTVWVDEANGMLVKQVDVWKSAPVPGAPSSVDGTFTLELTPPSAPPVAAHPGA
ncbi:MAG: hypothetical protein ACYC96_04040 [Fimbriimonadaceae bacterium]